MWGGSSKAASTRKSTAATAAAVAVIVLTVQMQQLRVPDGDVEPTTGTARLFIETESTIKENGLNMDRSTLAEKIKNLQAKKILWAGCRRLSTHSMSSAREKLVFLAMLTTLQQSQRSSCTREELYKSL